MVEIDELGNSETNIQEIIEDDNDEEFISDTEEVCRNKSNVGGIDKQETKAIQNEEFDQDDILEESLLERICALVDIIPPKTRARISTSFSNSLSLGFGLGKNLGSGLWMLATGSLLVFLPVSLELERDSMAIQQEMQVRQSSQ